MHDSARTEVNIRRLSARGAGVDADEIDRRLNLAQWPAMDRDAVLFIRRVSVRAPLDVLDDRIGREVRHAAETAVSGWAANAAYAGAVRFATRAELLAFIGLALGENRLSSYWFLADWRHSASMAPVDSLLQLWLGAPDQLYEILMACVNREVFARVAAAIPDSGLDHIIRGVSEAVDLPCPSMEEWAPRGGAAPRGRPFPPPMRMNRWRRQIQNLRPRPACTRLLLFLFFSARAPLLLERSRRSERSSWIARFFPGSTGAEMETGRVEPGPAALPDADAGGEEREREAREEPGREADSISPGIGAISKFDSERRETSDPAPRETRAPGEDAAANRAPGAPRPRAEMSHPDVARQDVHTPTRIMLDSVAPETTTAGEPTVATTNAGEPGSVHIATNPDELSTAWGGSFHLINFITRDPCSDQISKGNFAERLPSHWPLVHDLALTLDVPFTDPVMLFFRLMAMDARRDRPFFPGNRLDPLVDLAAALYGEELWRPELARKTARATWSDTHVDVHYDLDAIDIRVRLAGLDLNPGWRPELGRVILFHYH